MKEEIRAYCSQLGLEKIGFIECRTFNELRSFYENRKKENVENEFEENEIEKRINPKIYLSEGKTIITIAFPYFHEESLSNNGLSIYTKGEDYHNVVNKYLYKICEFIESNGGKAVPLVDSNALPERYIAALGEIGFIGKNNLLITKEYGSYVFLGEIITDLEIYEDDKTTLEDVMNFKSCGECNDCYKDCPTKAINSVKKNCNICLSYLTQKKELSDWELSALNGRVFGCDTCQLVCKYNKGVKASDIMEFKPLSFMSIDNTEDILAMGNSEFKQSFKTTSCGWRGKNVLKRNAMIRKNKFLNEKIQNLKTDSPYLNDYKNRLLNNGNL
ncbi:MAG: tRNA epoxyqueuosine(34) reductase QueG [Clostridium sp.]